MTPRDMLIAVFVVSAGSLTIGVERSGATDAGLGSCAAYSGLPTGEGETAGMVFIPGGDFTMGSERHQPEERFAHSAQVDGFWIDRHEVTNAQFRQFVEATGYATLAERGLDPRTHPSLPKALLAPGSVVFIQPTDLKGGGRLTQWWRYVAGANWREPQGPGSSITGKENDPVGISLTRTPWPTRAGRDAPSRPRRNGSSPPAAGATARTTGRALSTPRASRSRTPGRGSFPSSTRRRTASRERPVGCFPPNGHGLYDMIGNVWEWTTDWYRPGHLPDAAVNPAGPNLAQLRVSASQPPSRVIKGGSYLCAHNYCARYRPAARQPQEVDLGAAHLGFRTVLNRPDNRLP